MGAGGEGALTGACCGRNSSQWSALATVLWNKMACSSFPLQGGLAAQLVTGSPLGSNHSVKTVSLCSKVGKQGRVVTPAKHSKLWRISWAYTQGSAAKAIARRETTCVSCLNSPGLHPHWVPTGYPLRRCFPQRGQKCWVGRPELFLQHPWGFHVQILRAPLASLSLPPAGSFWEVQ